MKKSAFLTASLLLASALSFSSVAQENANTSGNVLETYTVTVSDSENNTIFTQKMFESHVDTESNINIDNVQTNIKMKNAPFTLAYQDNNITVFGSGSKNFFILTASRYSTSCDGTRSISLKTPQKLTFCGMNISVK